MQGKLIVFEGVEGCGKSTQIKRLADWVEQAASLQKLRHQGHLGNLVLTREPGGTQLGGHLRQLLLGQSAAVAIADRAELLLYAADRAQHVEEVIRPALQRGDWVLCDRYCDSTVAYQGYGRGLDLDLIGQLNQIATGGLMPDLTLWLKLDASLGLARTRQRGTADRMELADLAFHQRVQQGFEQLALSQCDRMVPVEAEADIAAVSEEIQGIVERSVGQWYGLL